MLFGVLSEHWPIHQQNQTSLCALQDGSPQVKWLLKILFCSPQLYFPLCMSPPVCVNMIGIHFADILSQSLFFCILNVLSLSVSQTTHTVSHTTHTHLFALDIASQSFSQALKTAVCVLNYSVDHEDDLQRQTVLDSPSITLFYVVHVLQSTPS
jgi:hypothetical protein